MEKIRSSFKLFSIAVAASTLFACVLNAQTATADESAKCAKLQSLALDHVMVTSAEAVSAGYSFSFPGMFIGLPFFKEPASCRIQGTIKPSADSDIRFELWMPQTGWNNKLQGIGNGGLAGSIDTLSLRAALQHNYAAAATDTGHEAGDKDGSWALDHPEKLHDYGYRAIHETASVSKAIIAAYYGRGPRYSYFDSGSNGGRAALMEAQRYPEDYDGILAGAPALDGTNTIATAAWMQQIMLKDPKNYIPASKLPAITAAALAACDGADGVKDGLIDDPRACNFQPESLLCKGEDSDTCLSEPQMRTLRAIYDGPGGAFGNSVNHGFERGGETGWADWIIGSAPRKSLAYLYALEFYRYLIYGDASWTLDRFQFERDRRGAEEHLGKDYVARDPDLSRFVARGGKLILYHGWNDYALQPRLTIDYYESVRAHMGAEQSEKFMRLYMVPGMEHCFGGPGPNVFGQIPATGIDDPARNISKALEVWVETGIAPGRIVATKYDEVMRPLFAPEKATALRSRPLCPYPQVARWTGKGSTDEAKNFKCGTP